MTAQIIELSKYLQGQPEQSIVQSYLGNYIDMNQPVLTSHTYGISPGDIMEAYFEDALVHVHEGNYHEAVSVLDDLKDYIVMNLAEKH